MGHRIIGGEIVVFPIATPDLESVSLVIGKGAD
jgi:hypothetical protein